MMLRCIFLSFLISLISIAVLGDSKSPSTSKGKACRIALSDLGPNADAGTLKFIEELAEHVQPFAEAKDEDELDQALSNLLPTTEIVGAYSEKVKSYFENLMTVAILKQIPILWSPAAKSYPNYPNTLRDALFESRDLAFDSSRVALELCRQIELHPKDTTGVYTALEIMENKHNVNALGDPSVQKAVGLLLKNPAVSDAVKKLLRELKL